MEEHSTINGVATPVRQQDRLVAIDNTVKLFINLHGHRTEQELSQEESVHGKKQAKQATDKINALREKLKQQVCVCLCVGVGGVVWVSTANLQLLASLQTAACTIADTADAFLCQLRLVCRTSASVNKTSACAR
jgi:hypothetical protein